MTYFRALILACLISLCLGCQGSSSGGAAQNLDKMNEHKDAICNAKSAQAHAAAKSDYEAFQGKESVVNWAMSADPDTKKKLQSISARLMRCYNRSF